MKSRPLPAKSASPQVNPASLVKPASFQKSPTLNQTKIMMPHVKSAAIQHTRPAPASKGKLVSSPATSSSLKLPKPQDGLLASVTKTTTKPHQPQYSTMSPSKEGGVSSSLSSFSSASSTSSSSLAQVGKAQAIMHRKKVFPSKATALPATSTTPARSIAPFPHSSSTIKLPALSPSPSVTRPQSSALKQAPFLHTPTSPTPTSSQYPRTPSSPSSSGTSASSSSSISLHTSPLTLVHSPTSISQSSLSSALRGSPSVSLSLPPVSSSSAHTTAAPLATILFTHPSLAPVPSPLPLQQQRTSSTSFARDASANVKKSAVCVAGGRGMGVVSSASAHSAPRAVSPVTVTTLPFSSYASTIILTSPAPQTEHPISQSVPTHIPTPSTPSPPRPHPPPPPPLTLTISPPFAPSTGVQVFMAGGTGTGIKSPVEQIYKEHSYGGIATPTPTHPLSEDSVPLTEKIIPPPTTQQ